MVLLFLVLCWPQTADPRPATRFAVLNPPTPSADPKAPALTTSSETAPRSLRLRVRGASQPACPRCFVACVLLGRQDDADKVGMSVVK